MAWLFAIEGPGAFEEVDDLTQRDAAGAVDGEKPFEWQSFLQTYFPAYQKSLVLPEPERRDGMFVFRVSLGKIWRRIAMPADATLDELVTWILRSVEFSSDHLYEFRYRDRFGAEVRVSHPACEEAPWTTDIHIGELPLEPGHSMTLIYDFGDNWQFDVRLERIDPPTKKHGSPRILAKHGDSPEQYPQW